MVRGIERRPLSWDDRDRQDFVGRMRRLAAAQAFTVYTWALLPSHFHLLGRTARHPVARAMRLLPTWYAAAFNPP